MYIIDPDQFSRDFRAYVRGLPAALLVASESTAFESWFRVELGVTLMKLGVRREQVNYNYSYPTPENRGRKADLCIYDGKPVVFELKSFSTGADSNKLAEFPRQNQLLRKHVVSGHFQQGVSFATFFGYSDKSLQTIIGRLYPSEAHWKISGPHPLLDGFPLVFIVAVTGEAGA